MRPSFKVQTKPIQNVLEAAFKSVKMNDARNFVQCLLTVEIMTYAFLADFDPQLSSLQNVYSLQKRFDAILPRNTNLERIQALRHYFNFSLQTFEAMCDTYMKIPRMFRLYDIDASIKNTDAVRLIRPNPFCSELFNREQVYKETLTPKAIAHASKSEYTFFDKSNTVYYLGDYERIGDHQERKKIYIKVPEPMWETTEHTCLKNFSGLFAKPTSKVRLESLSLKITDDMWSTTGEQITEALVIKNRNRKFNRDWVAAARSIRLIETRNNPTGYLKYQGRVNVVGLVGAGKTTFTYLETFRLVKLGAKVLILTYSTDATIKICRDLKAMGLLATPIIGKTNKQDHLKRMLEHKINETVSSPNFESVFHKIADDPMSEYFGASCMLLDLAGENSENLPCEKFIDKDTKKEVLCPFFLNCDVKKADRELASAEVWVGTLQAVLNSSPGRLFDPKNRTYFELAHERIDVVFLDEADKLQQLADQDFVSVFDLFGSHSGLFEELYSWGTTSLNTTGISSSAMTYTWSEILYESHKLRHLIHATVENSEHVRKFLIHKPFNRFTLATRIAHFLTGDEAGSTDIHKSVMKALVGITTMDDDFVSSQALQFANEIKNIIKDSTSADPVLVAESRNKCSLNLLLSNLEDKPYKEITEKVLHLFEFYVLFGAFDQLLVLLLRYLPMVEYLSQKTFDRNETYLYSKKDGYRPFIPDPLTMSYLQYQFTTNDNQSNTGMFQLIEYLGVGRELLNNLGVLYSKIEDYGDMASISLSGTSYAPGSAHFHVHQETPYLLESASEERPVVTQFFHPVYNRLGFPIKISGLPQHEKENALRSMAIALLPAIRRELGSWKQEGRKVLLVVNSYDQSRLVADTLRPYLNVKAVLKEADEKDLFPSEIEFAGSKDLDVLVLALGTGNRAHNILVPGQSKSLFGSVFFLTRPYIVPRDISSFIQILHGSFPEWQEHVATNQMHFYDGAKYIHSKANEKMKNMFRTMRFEFMKKEDREVLAWYTFINVWQMIGRLLRGNSDARVFYVDASFAPRTATQSDKSDDDTTSMLLTWKKVVSQDKSLINQKLYEIFLKGIDNVFQQEEKY